MPRTGNDLPLNANTGIPVAGAWNAETNCVEVNGQRNDIAWAAARMSVKRAMFVNANSSTMRNNLDLAVFGAKNKLNATLDVATNAKVAVDPEAFGTADVTFALTGKLPAGVTFDKYTGAFSGTPIEDGTYELVIDIAADGGWIKSSAAFTLKVSNDLFEMPKLGGKVGEAVNAKVDSSILREEGASLTFFAENLPAGVAIDGSGNITGAPAQAGVYDVVIHATAETAPEDNGSGNPFFNSSATSTVTEYLLHVEYVVTAN